MMNLLFYENLASESIKSFDYPHEITIHLLHSNRIYSVYPLNYIPLLQMPSDDKTYYPLLIKVDILVQSFKLFLNEKHYDLLFLKLRQFYLIVLELSFGSTLLVVVYLLKQSLLKTSPRYCLT